MPRQTFPPDPDLPRYGSWDQVPAGLRTKTQLGQLSPPRKPAPEASPVAQARYMGNQFAPLYRLADTVEKQQASPAQRAAAARARELQWVCRRCGTPADPDGPPLGSGRLCSLCRAADRDHREHQQARERANELLIRGGATLVLVHAAMASMASAGRDHDLPTRVVALHVDSGQLLADLTADPDASAGPASYPAVLGELHRVLTEHGAWHFDTGYPDEPDYAHRYLTGWALHTSIAACLRLLNPDADGADWWRGRERYPWLNSWSTIQDSIWATWYREPSADGLSLNWRPPLPGATGDILHDARTAARLLQDIAAGRAPTSPAARWQHPTHGVPARPT